MLYRISLLKPYSECSVAVNLRTVERIALEKSKIEFYYNRSFLRSPSCVVRFEDHKRAVEVYDEIQRKIEKQIVQEIHDGKQTIRWDQPQPDLWAIQELESYQPQKAELK